MGSRRKAREHALKLLYQLDVAPTGVDEALRLYWGSESPEPASAEFAERLVRGVHEHREEIDGLIESHTFHWRLPRIAAVDRNILRMALYEFLYLPETPRAVVINEALEIAKRYSTEESSPFINGVLDGIRRVLEEGDGEGPAPGPAGEPESGEPPG
jgi:N utilization substance protein B